jgi:hypothetical protein
MTNTLHAHVSTASADCDGPMYDEYVITLNDEEIAETEQQYNDFHEIHFRERVMCSIVHVTGGNGTLSVHSEPGGWADRIEWHQQTEEGYRSAEAVFCEDDCDTGVTSHRDVYAEMMGY